MKTVRKTLAAGLMAAMAMAVHLVGAGDVQADTTAALTVTVTVQRVSITATFRDAAATTLVLADVLEGSETVMPDPITVTNSGNVTQTYALQITGEAAGWTSVLTDPAADNEYQMAGLFLPPATAAPDPTDFVDTEDSYDLGLQRTANGSTDLTIGGGGAGNGGFQMPFAAGTENIYLWLKFHAPSNTTTDATARNIVTTITAATP